MWPPLSKHLDKDVKLSLACVLGLAKHLQRIDHIEACCPCPTWHTSPHDFLDAFGV